MVGRYPADELWRVALALAVIALLGGLLAGFVRAPPGPRRAGRAAPSPVWWRRRLDLAWAGSGRCCSGSPSLLSMTTTVGPWLAVAGVDRRRRRRPAARRRGSRCPRRSSVVVGVLPSASCWSWFLSRPLPWDEWGGLMLNVFLAVAAIALCFPLGVLLALGRRPAAARAARSTACSPPIVLGLLPIVLYVVLLGGITIAVVGHAGRCSRWPPPSPSAGWGSAGSPGCRWCGPSPSATSSSSAACRCSCCCCCRTSPSASSCRPAATRRAWSSRAIVAFTLFTAAYVAEIVRGGLQSLPRGQTEAAQALGLSPVRTTALIVLPQALRNVIPGLVGQFISLFKDTTLAGSGDDVPRRAPGRRSDHQAARLPRPGLIGRDAERS